jgi:hypothetical protein
VRRSKAHQYSVWSLEFVLEETWIEHGSNQISEIQNQIFSYIRT